MGKLGCPRRISVNLVSTPLNAPSTVILTVPSSREDTLLERTIQRFVPVSETESVVSSFITIASRLESNARPALILTEFAELAVGLK